MRDFFRKACSKTIRFRSVKKITLASPKSGDRILVPTTEPSGKMSILSPLSHRFPSPEGHFLVPRDVENPSKDPRLVLVQNWYREFE